MKRQKKPTVPISEETPFDYGTFEREAIIRLTKGDKLVGPDGVLTGMIQRLVGAALQGEMSHHLKEGRLEGGKNRRNGHTRKTLSTELGPVQVSPPRDRDGTFEPLIVGKWERELGAGMGEQILHLYSLGNSVSDIRRHLYEIYGLEYSAGAISEVTERVWEEVVEWQRRELKAFYAAIFLDGIYFKVREDGRTVTKVMYSVYGVDAEGNREILGIYTYPSESAGDWGRVLEDLKRRGVVDVLFFCVDGLAGFSDAIWKVFPRSLVQRCIVHMVRGSTKHVPDKHMREVCADLRRIYTAADEGQARMALDAVRSKWGKLYPEVAGAWEAGWADLTVFLEYGQEVRRMIYTTNAVEALHRHIRKVTKAKGGWASEKALVKQVYLTLVYGKGGWQKKVFNWVPIVRELREKFPDRFPESVF